MNRDNTAALRQYIASVLAGGHAFATPDKILGGVPPDVRGVRVDGVGRSLWELLEHLRIDQEDLLAFCTAAEYRELTVPDDFWPDRAAPESDEEWERKVATFLDDLERAKRHALDPSIDLFGVVANGTTPTQTWARVLLLIAEHNAYHLGQFITMRKVLGAW